MAKQTITAVYDSREYANNAALKLRQAGVPDTDVTISPETAASDYSAAADRPAKGFWASLEDMFGGSDDHQIYAEGVRRGGTMLTAHVDDTKVDDAVRIVEEHGSIDLNERETAWRKDGWTGDAAITGGGVADTGAGPLRSMAPDGASKPVVASAPIPTREAVRPSAVSAPTALSTSRDRSDDVLQVVEEQLNVGKRAVNRGKVRIHSYVVETPITQTVSLRDETVSVDRRPVNRAVGAAELGVDAFKDRMIEMDEIDEEAVVGKTTRVVEEIGMRKDVKDEVRTITDTVRSTKVDVEDGRTAGARTARITGFTTEIADDMEVVGSDGQHVGAVDHVDGDNIKLKKMDPTSGGQHHLIPTTWVKTIDKKVTLKTAAADVKSRWLAA